MSPDDLEQRFALALRRALDGAQPGAPVVHVAAPNVTLAPTFTPTIKATLPMPSEPVAVVDVERWAGAWRYRMAVKRTAGGFIESVDLLPVKFLSAEEIANGR